MEAVKEKPKNKQKKRGNSTKNRVQIDVEIREDVDPIPESSANINVAEELLNAASECDDTNVEDKAGQLLENGIVETKEEEESEVVTDVVKEPENNELQAAERIENKTKEKLNEISEVKENVNLASVSYPELPKIDAAIEKLEKEKYDLQQNVGSVPKIPKVVYPELPKEAIDTEKSSLRPYTEEQLAALYKNSELELLQTFTSQYIEAELKGISVKRHPLYELLTNYLHVREKITGNTIELNQLTKEYEDCRNHLWTSEGAFVTGRGECQDGVVVLAKQVYQKASFNKTVFDSVVRILSNIRKVVNENYVLYSYSAEDLRLQIELYIQTTLSNVINATQLQKNAPVSLTMQNEPQHLHPYLSEVRLCISVLFCFQRRLIRDVEFAKKTREWLERLVAVLLRVANYQDHLFILSHILRCPGGISEWATSYIQTPLPERLGDSPFTSYEVNHIITVLELLLTPVEKRDQFLDSLTHSKESAIDVAWVVVDSDGEEDEESSGASLRENDLVCILNQLRLGDVFRAILLVETRNYEDSYESTNISEYHILKFLSFSTVLVKILHRGLKTYRQPKYQQFSKRLSRFIRHIVQYATDQWEQFKESRNIDEDAMLLRIQTEYDAFFLRATYYLYSSQKLGAWQFLAVVPYNIVSARALWKLFYFLHDSDHLAESILKFYEKLDYKSKLWDQMVRNEFEEKLGSLSDAEIYYLLNTFANMALARDSRDMDFIQTATMDLLHVGFINEATQETCSKSARILLTHITSKHPYLLSEILCLIKENMEKVGSYSLYLYEELPLSIWRPTENDMKIISFLLLNHQVTQDESRLARMIISRLNWGFSNDKNLFLPYTLHRKVALLAVEAAEKEPGYAHWAWQTLVRLRLHVNDRGITEFTDIPDINNCAIVSKGVREQQPLACFLSVLMTTLGHMIPIVCTEGLKQLLYLQTQQKHEAVMFALHLLVPLFINSQELLINSESYQNVLIGLINADRTYINMAKSLVVAQNTILTQFGNMIESHISNYGWYRLETPRLLVRLWMNSLVSIPGWNKNNGVLYLLDLIIRTAFFHSDAYEATVGIIKDLMQESPQEHSGSISSVLKWVSQTSPPRGNLITYSLLSYSWLAYVLIDLEHEEKERRSGLWKEILNQLRLQKGKVNVDSAIKKGASILKVQSFSSGSLCLYRWAQQAMDAPVDHPLLPLLWQKFFFLYLMRVPVHGVADRGCVGEKFFDGLINFTFLKRLKRRLQETVDHYRKELSEMEEEEDELKKLAVENYLKLFNAYALWLEEPRLQDVNLHLPSLPPQYMPQLLALVIHGDTTPWLEYVDYDRIKFEQMASVKTWRSSNFRERSNVNQPLPNAGSTVESNDPVTRILRRLASYDTPKPPPEIKMYAPVVPSADFRDKDSFLKSLEPCFKTLQEFARNHNLHISQHKALDCTYQDLVPQLYRYVLKKVVKQEPCRGRNNTVLCAGPARIALEMQEARINERIEHQMESNRNDYDMLLKKLLQAPAKSLCSSSVAIQQTIRILQAQQQCNAASAELGVELFYKMLSCINEESNIYPPAKILFSSCLEKLGHSHLNGVEFQMPRLLYNILENPNLSEYLVPHFSTAKIGTQSLLLMYSTVSEKVCQKCNVNFSLLSKFDIYHWLVNTKPKISQRSELLKIIIKALTTMGFEPPKEFSLIHEVYRKHLLNIFEFQFPEHYGEVLISLLKASNTASGTGCVSVSVWMDVLNAISKPVQLKLSTSMRDQLRQYAQHQRMLQHQELLDTAGLLAQHFTNERLQYGLYGLFPKCRNYIEVFVLLIGMTGHSLIVSSLNTHEGALGDRLCEIIWPYLRDMFAPWLVPYSVQNLKENMASWIQQLTDDRSVILPWITADGPYAQKVLSMFLECVLFVTHTLPASSTILSYIWQWYVTSFAHPSVKDYVHNPVHGTLMALPWHNFWPTLADLELMLRVVEQYLPECHTFLGHVFMSVLWPVWLGNINDKVSPQVATRIHHCLLHLFVKLSSEPKVRAFHVEKAKMLLVQAENFHWPLIEPNVYQQIMDWYVMSCDPLVIFKSDPLDLDFRMLHFLKIVSGYDKILDKPSPEALEKRRIFIRSYVKILSAFMNRFKSTVPSKTFEIRSMINSQLSHMEAVIKTSDELKIILGEFLTVLNFNNISDVAEKSFVSWMNIKSGDGIFVKQMLQITAASVSDSNLVAMILETAISIYFQNRGPQSEEATWREVTELVGVYLPRLNELEQACVTHGCLLTLYALLLQRISKSKDDISVINISFDWLEEIKVTESVESKVPLLWAGVLTLAVRHCKINESETAIVLHKFCEILLKQSEDKGSSIWKRGILGAIGIGKNQQISLKFLSKALVGYVLAQLPDCKGDAQVVRQEPNVPGIVGQPGGNSECVKILLGLDFGQSQGKIKDCAESALKQIQNPKNSLHNSLKFLTDLLKQLYSKPYLKVVEV